MVNVVKTLDEVVLRAINGIEVGESKKEAVKEVSAFVDENYINKATLSDISILPAKDAADLYQKFGIEFHIKDGRFTGLRIERMSYTNQLKREA